MLHNFSKLGNLFPRISMVNGFLMLIWQRFIAFAFKFSVNLPYFLVRTLTIFVH